MHSLLADVILILHFAFVAFVVGGFVLIWLGAALRWRWIADRRFRIAHLAAIIFVALESLGGFVCPLTLWEDALRGRGSDLGFIARWVHAVLFYELPAWVFTTAYVAFAIAVAATWRLIPPGRTAKRSGAAPQVRTRTP